MKRQQAAEDAIAIGLRAVATGAVVEEYLPQGPIYGVPVTEPHVSQEKSKMEDEMKVDESVESEALQEVSKSELQPDSLEGI